MVSNDTFKVKSSPEETDGTARSAEAPEDAAAICTGKMAGWIKQK